MSKLNVVLVSLILSFLAACSPKGSDSLKPLQMPMNVILLIGDGMGLAQVSGSIYLSEEPSNFRRFRFVGLHEATPAGKEKITDSAAGGTAIACGVKALNGRVGLDVAGKPKQSILIKASEMGKSTGLIATSPITHATPASFFAHVPDRNSAEEIARQYVYAPVDIGIAGGYKFFYDRKDGCNYLDTLITNQVVVDTTELRSGLSINNRYTFLVTPDSLPSIRNGRGGFLSDATRTALDYLSQDKDGFFLMVEGSQIDWGGHQNDTGRVIEEMEDFNKVVGLALDYAEKAGNTLVIVTADHETGGFALSPEGKDYSTIVPTFSTKEHTASLIPVFAFGPEAEQFAGVYQNTDIFHKMLRSLKKQP